MKCVVPQNKHAVVDIGVFALSCAIAKVPSESSGTHIDYFVQLCQSSMAFSISGRYVTYTRQC